MLEESTDSAGLIDWAAALECAGGDQDLLRELANAFQDEATDRLAAIQRAMREQDYVLLHRSAHTLGSLLGTFGAASVMALARQLESHFKGLADDRRRIDKGEENPGVITRSRVATVFEGARAMVAAFEPRMNQVIAEVLEGPRF